MLLNNWFYFKKQIIEFKNINFITGKNKAGKSTLIDAMQVVLLGEKSGIFNKAAANKSDRKLEGYLWADDGSGVSPRKGKSFETYIAMEFFDDIKISYFTIGVVFECDAGGSYNFRYFIFEGQIPENLFYENGDTMDIYRLRSFLNVNYRNVKLFETDKAYKKEIIARFNVHTEKYFSMIKKGVAFDPINNIPKFITESICDIDVKIDTVEMQSNVRDYQHQLRLAEEIEKKIKQLNIINDYYLSMRQALSTVKKQEYIVARASCEANTEILDSLYSDYDKNKKEIDALAQTISQLDNSIQDVENKIRNLNIYLNQDEAYKIADRLEQEIKNNLEKIEKINCDLNELLLKIKTYVSSLNSGVANLENSLINDLESIELIPKVNHLKDKLAHLNSLTVEELKHKDKEFWHAYGQALCDFGQYVAQIKYIEEQKYKSLLNRKIEIENEISQLKKGKKPYDKGLIAFKSDLEDTYLRQTGQPLNAEFFADLIEMTDESWHNAVEGYLGKRRYYLIVDPEKYLVASKLFKQIRKNSNYPFHLIGIADIGKIKEKESLELYIDCLAEKVVTQNEFAHVYVKYLMGKVVCCENIEDLRKNKSSITKDGILY